MKKPNRAVEPQSVEVRTARTFRREFKRLLKKYPSLEADVLELSKQLQQNPQLGESLGGNCYKIRLAIRSKGQGKSGGARVITLVVLAEAAVTLVTMYDKSEKEDLLPGELDALLAGLTGPGTT